ncbi:MAG: YicC family protein [Bauldia sp.]|nr:YicC family protein [Bauldia sp.]
MALESMTGFARVDGGSLRRWAWELRSVNGKGLDVRLRVPGGFERLEPMIRERIAGRLSRGNVQAQLSVEDRSASQRIVIDDAVLSQVIEAMARIGARIDAQPPTLDGILSIRGVVSVEDAQEDEEARATLDREVLSGLDAALDALAQTRRQEGSAIGGLLQARLDEIAALTRKAEDTPARRPEAIRLRLAEQVATLLDAVPALDPDRLHQEAVLLATKADIREELDRLDAHVVAARELLASGGAIGRRLDFIAQEFNREVNTLCSKANDRSLTAVGLDMKAVVDQLREQIQNLE